MLERETTFIIGAGASHDLGFPLGDTLRNRIIDLLALEDPTRSINFSDPILSRILQDRANREGGGSWPDKFESYRRAAADIRAGLPFARSIDTFIDGLRHTDHVEFLSKLAIATVILRSESRSPLLSNASRTQTALDRKQLLDKLLTTWHTELTQILYDGHSLETLPQIFKNVSFIIFNYDRCIEEFLTTSLMRRFAIERNRALQVVRSCRIIHPYGQTGSFFPDEDGFVPFGIFEDHQLISISERIRTFTETMDSSIAETIKDVVAGADTLVFMGFGWLPQNMELLKAERRVSSAGQVFATTMNMPSGEIGVVREKVDEILRRRNHTPEHYDLTIPSPVFVAERGDCKALMRNCWLRLTRT